MSTKFVTICKRRYRIFRITCFSKLGALSCSCKYLFQYSPQDFEEIPAGFTPTPPQNSSTQDKRKNSPSIAPGVEHLFDVKHARMT